jgi:hypothetical protein
MSNYDILMGVDCMLISVKWPCLKIHSREEAKLTTKSTCCSSREYSQKINK